MHMNFQGFGPHQDRLIAANPAEFQLRYRGNLYRRHAAPRAVPPANHRLVYRGVSWSRTPARRPAPPEARPLRYRGVAH